MFTVIALYNLSQMNTNKIEYDILHKHFEN